MQLTAEIASLKEQLATTSGNQLKLTEAHRVLNETHTALVIGFNGAALM